MLNVLRRSSTANSAWSERDAAVGGTGGRRPSAMSVESLQSRFTGFRLGRSKSETPAVVVPASGQSSFGELFFALPTELQLQVLLELPFKDIRSCRILSKSFDALVRHNGARISRVCAGRDIPSYCSLLYLPSPHSLAYLYTLSHRHAVSASLAHTLAVFILTEILRQRLDSKRHSQQLDQARLECKMTPLLFLLAYFFDSWRAWLLSPANPCNHPSAPTPTHWTASTASRTAAKQILSNFTDRMLFAANSMHRLLFSAFARQLRPPTYMTTVERSIRGWSGRPPAREVLSTTFAIGGPAIIAHVLDKRTYGARVKAVENFLSSLSAHETVRWRDNWQNMIHGPFASLRPVADAPDPPPKLDCTQYDAVWEPLAVDVLIERGVIASAAEIASTRHFISGLLGYDILLGPTVAPTLEVITSFEGAGAEEEDEGEDDEGSGATEGITDWRRQDARDRQTTSNNGSRSNGNSDDDEDEAGEMTMADMREWWD